MKKTNQKGFTLIELLVVVAIIGALAAVGVVAYNGYTAAAKKNSTKSIHANATKYIASEMAKCNIDGEPFGGDISCPGTAAAVLTLLTGTDSPMKDKNPFDTGEDAVGSGNSSTATDASDLGYVVVTVDGNDIVLTTEYDESEDALESKICIGNSC